MANFNWNGDWANYITKKLDLDAYEEDDLIHDLNNLRGDEWIDAMVAAGIDKKTIKNFKKFIKSPEALNLA